jgi:hypothetical protein
LLLIKYSGDQIKEDEMGGACGTYGEEKCMQVFFRKPNRRPLAIYMRKCECNIKGVLKEDDGIA